LSCLDGDPLSDPFTYPAWWVASNILLYRSLIFPLLSIKCVSSCTTLVLPIFRLSSAFFGILKVQLSKVLCFTSPMTSLYVIFSDADWAGSTTGACIFFSPNLLTWTAKKQSIVSCSSSKAEYRALAHMAAEICWFGFLFRELGVPLQTAPCIYVDNLSAIHMAANPIFHARTWHIEIDYHFVRELVARKSLHTFYVPSSHQLADVFTKGLSRDRFSLLKYKLNLRVAPLRLRGGKENITPANPIKSVSPMQSAYSTTSALEVS